MAFVFILALFVLFILLLFRLKEMKPTRKMNTVIISTLPWFIVFFGFILYFCISGSMGMLAWNIVVCTIMGLSLIPLIVMLVSIKKISQWSRLLGIIPVLIASILFYDTFKPPPPPSPYNRTWQEYQLELASKKLKKGMTKEEVIKAIGTPDFEHETYFWWRSTWGTNDPPYTSSQHRLKVEFAGEWVTDIWCGWVTFHGD